MSIPKIIHQIWLQGEIDIPKKYLSKTQRIKDMHQTWKYYFWDDVSIVDLLSKNTIWLNTYHKLNYLHQKVDYARYIILYIYGGVYIDMDVKMVKPLDSLLQKYIGYDFIVSRLNLNYYEAV